MVEKRALEVGVSGCVVKEPSVKRDSRRGRRVVVVGSGGAVIVMVWDDFVCMVMFSAGLMKVEEIRDAISELCFVFEREVLLFGDRC